MSIEKEKYLFSGCGYCGGCGAELSSGMRFCPVCGTPVMESHADAGKSKEKTKTKVLISVGVIAVTAVIIAIVCCSRLANRKNVNTNSGDVVYSVSESDQTQGNGYKESNDLQVVSEQSMSGGEQTDNQGNTDVRNTVNSDFSPVEGYLEGCAVSILGAEATRDSEGNSAICIYYSFTNCSGDVTNADWTLGYKAVAGTDELEKIDADSEDSLGIYGNDVKNIYPGVTILCQALFRCDKTEDVITFSIYIPSDSDMAISCDFSYSNLPGRPALLETDPIYDPILTEDLPSADTIDQQYRVALTGYEIVADTENGQTLVRVFMDFTNNTKTADISCSRAVYLSAYQDGVELSSLQENLTGSDELYDTEIAPGETISCSHCFVLGNNDPVEAVAEGIFVYSNKAGLFCPIE